MLRSIVVAVCLSAFVPHAAVVAQTSAKPTFAQRLKSLFVWRNPFKKKQTPPNRTFVNSPIPKGPRAAKPQRRTTIDRSRHQPPPQMTAGKQTAGQRLADSIKAGKATQPAQQEGASIDGNRVFSGSNTAEESRKRRYFAGRGSSFNERGLPSGAGAARRPIGRGQ